MTVEELKIGNAIMAQIEAISKVAIFDRNANFRFVDNLHSTDIERVVKMFEDDFLNMLKEKREMLKQEFKNL